MAGDPILHLNGTNQGLIYWGFGFVFRQLSPYNARAQRELIMLFSGAAGFLPASILLDPT